MQLNAETNRLLIGCRESDPRAGKCIGKKYPPVNGREGKGCGTPPPGCQMERLGKATGLNAGDLNTAMPRGWLRGWR